MNIFKAMKPEKVYESLVHIPWEELYGSGIETALLDFDNTLGPDHATEPEEYSYECVKMIEEKGIKCCLVSNAKSGRSARIAEMLGIPIEKAIEQKKVIKKVVKKVVKKPAPAKKAEPKVAPKAEPKAEPVKEEPKKVASPSEDKKPSPVKKKIVKKIIVKK